MLSRAENLHQPVVTFAEEQNYLQRKDSKLNKDKHLAPFTFTNTRKYTYDFMSFRVYEEVPGKLDVENFQCLGTLITER